jgi:hypothetical protein
MPIGLPLPTAELQLFPTTGTSWSAHLPRGGWPRRCRKGTWHPVPTTILFVVNAQPPPGTNVTGTVVAHHRWGLELLLDDWAEATVDRRFIDDDVAVIGDQSRWPAIGTRLSGRVQGTVPNGQLRVTLRRSDQMWTHASR